MKEIYFIIIVLCLILGFLLCNHPKEEHRIIIDKRYITYLLENIDSIKVNEIDASVITADSMIFDKKTCEILFRNFNIWYTYEKEIK